MQSEKKKIDGLALATTSAGVQQHLVSNGKGCTDARVWDATNVRT